MSRFNKWKWRTPRIIGTGMTKLGRSTDNIKPEHLMEKALVSALKSAKLELDELDALIAIPSLSHPHFMEAHHFATKIGLLPRDELVLRTVDTGGSGPITALLEAKRMIQSEHINKIAIVGGDCVSSLATNEFLRRADSGCQNNSDPLLSPVIPHGYNKYTKWQLDHVQSKYNHNHLIRDHFAMVPVLMSEFARKHPKSMMYNKARHSLEEVLNSPQIASHINRLECARRADGGAAIIVASTGHVKNIMTEPPDVDVVVLGGGEASGTLYPPSDYTKIHPAYFSCEAATTMAYRETNLKADDIDWFGLYDCFPICLIRAIEAVGLCTPGNGGNYIETIYNKLLENGDKGLDPNDFPINTHGGLLAFGAPWEVPALYSILEAVDQISKKAENRQINDCRRALVYGNGGIFSHSAVAILSESVE